ncbi:UDP-galactose transporter senju [Episyrphus balteatus]|uniref:UDP-galactose transporter senju n=1 Tax=Episyrphus balteatus TaxID=286459 RepID=UPI0024866FED|nr:UDP-galactose transporter senju [Episyrphus balteatus]XP_055857965.1 UDP-galactose transporter senju [Episyrphus balteatus]
MGGIVWRELFPTKLTCLIFIFYMSLFISQGILVTASQESNNSYSYNTVTVVLLTEVLKLVVSTGLYCRENTIDSLIKDIKRHSNVMMLYFVPAFLYCLYNNLAFVNLSTFDPTTYYLLLQLRVVITGILFQIIFKKYLTKRQWISLIILTVGCMLKQFNFNISSPFNSNSPHNTTIPSTNLNSEESSSIISRKNITGFDLSISAVWILVQTICSCLAGVYNEYLLKDKGAEVNIFVQNVFMYFDSIACNAAILILRGELLDAFTLTNIQSVFRFSVIAIIINNAAIGIVTSFFLKYMNSILKTFASALELLFTAVLCYFLFAIPIYINTALAIAVVSFAIYLYSQSPVVNLGKVVRQQGSLEANSMASRKLLDSDTELEMEAV